MSVLLLILKIIGIILLCIIGLVLLIVLYVLLAPFWFKIQGSNDRDMNYSVKVKASTFLHFIQVHIDYLKDTGLKYNVSIFGTLVKILPKNEQTKDKNSIEVNEDNDENEDDKDKIDSEAKTEQELKEDNEPVTAFEEQLETDKNRPDNQNIEIDDIQDIDEDKVKIVDTESDEFDELFNEEDKRFFIKVREFFARFHPKRIIEKIKEKIEELKKNADKILAVIMDEANKEWVKKILRELKKVIKSLGLNMRGTDVDFSLGEPDVTGQVSGVLALFPPIYDKKVRVIPDFTEEEMYIDGDIYIKGRLQLIFIVIFALVILLDSNTKRILNEIKQLKN